MFFTSEQTLLLSHARTHTRTHTHTTRNHATKKDRWPALLKEHDRRGSSSAGGVAPFTHTTRQGRIKKILYSRRRRRRARKKRATIYIVRFSIPLFTSCTRGNRTTVAGTPSHLI
ncbi:unnamed protein product, partial [Ectocarpus sp. 8 AP-2014]